MSVSHVPTRAARRGRRRGRLLVYAAVAAGLGALVPQALDHLGGEELLPLERVEVRGLGEAKGITAEEIEAYAELQRGTPILELDLASVTRKVERHPWVARATVRWHPPSTVVIETVAQKPSLLLALGSVYVADREGSVFKRAQATDGLDLPMLTGLATEVPVSAHRAQVAAAAQWLHWHEDLGAPGGRASELFVGKGAWRLTTDQGLVAHFMPPAQGAAGASSARNRLAHFARVVRAVKAQGGEPWVVHLDDDRRPERVAVRLRSGAEMRRSVVDTPTPRERKGRAG